MESGTSSPTHLIIVCCHAIYLGGPTNGASDSEWLLAPFQKDEAPTFVAHARAGMEVLISDPAALLFFSGSQTRREVDRSEAQGYLDLLRDNSFFGLLSSLAKHEREDLVKARILLEEKALDSFGNVLFSMIGFWRQTRTWPEKITIVSHEFKRERFMELHVKTLKLTVSHITVEYSGIDPGYMVQAAKEFSEARTEEVRKGELERGYRAWEHDLWGKGQLLREKRWKRNTWSVSQELFDAALNERELASAVTQSVEFEWLGEMVKEEVFDIEAEFPWQLRAPRSR